MLGHCEQELGGKKEKGLALNCTAKGKKEGVSEKVARFIVSIGYGVGVINAHHYKCLMNGKFFATFVSEHFKNIFENSTNPQSNLFEQDNDPSQSSAVARNAMEALGYSYLKIPARSPDLNPIENIFHHVNKELRESALTKYIKKESYDEFVACCQKTLMDFPMEQIDKTIESMHKSLLRWW